MTDDTKKGVRLDASALQDGAVHQGEEGFLWSSAPEPHAARRLEILARHPEVKSLYGPCPKTKYLCVALVLLQLGLCWLLRDVPLWLMLVAAYAVGGVINQMLLLAIHEISHNLAFKKPLANRLLGLFVNLPIGIPVAAAFREYHLMHHTDQGVHGIDTDVPTRWETRFVRGGFLKLLWLSCQGLAYGLRPLFMMPLRPSAWVVSNFLVQLVFDLCIYWLWGGQALAYLPVSTLIVMGLHPISGHYLSEHYVIAAPQETYSYYGPLNRLTFNVGYHNEHHDFPYIAGSRLAQLKRMAPEFYETLAHHSSWTKILWDYVTKPSLGPLSRIKRSSRSGASSSLG